MLIERGINAQNEVSFVLRIEKQYLELVELAKSNLAESNRTTVIFAIKVIYGKIIEYIYPALQGNPKSNFASIIEAQYQKLIELMELNLIEKNSIVFIPVIRQKYNEFLRSYYPPSQTFSVTSCLPLQSKSYTDKYSVSPLEAKFYKTS
ncbi:MAG: hypothetical protein SWX82_23520 [Cyanobacteriota bacterium]|nr:hypothetical protein [Cyanobacteriota bacterium]